MECGLVYVLTMAASDCRVECGCSLVTLAVSDGMWFSLCFYVCDNGCQ